MTPYKRKEPSAEDEEKRKKQNQLKRAEQNRQAQRAFRERREKSVPPPYPSSEDRLSIRTR